MTDADSSTTGADPSRDWAHIDADSETEEFVEVLDEAAAREGYIEVKLQRHELLDLSPGDRVLDVGCGQGVDVRLLSSRVGPEWEVVGVDISEKMLDAARERTEHTSNVRFESGDVMDLSFADDSFDAVQCERVLVHTDAPEQALSELARVTRPGGRVGVTEPDLGSILIETPGGQSMDELNPAYAVHKQPLLGRRLFRLVREAGWTNIDVDLNAEHVPNFEFAAQALMLEEWLDAMASAREIPRSEADEWLEGCRQASDEELFFGAGMLFTVVGTVPGNE
jgi:ubiquinone/menaquinone biosynthesis C-methylase UbiE